MATVRDTTADDAEPREAGRPAKGAGRAPVWRDAWSLARQTTLSGIRYRVTGLAGEAAFFALLSLPPLGLGLLGTLVHFRGWLGSPNDEVLRRWVEERALTFLTEPTFDHVLRPLMDDVLQPGRVPLISLGFVLSLWAGSRAVFVYIDLITVSYGLDEVRGIVKTRLLGFVLYLAALVVGLVLLPIMVIGPSSLADWLPGQAGLIEVLYWPVVLALSIAGLTTLYHVSVPIRTRWRRELPGALVALVIWVPSAGGLRWILDTSFSPATIYGSLAAPIAVLLWLYVTALAVLIGAMVNAEWDKLWPENGTARVRAQAVQHQQ